MRRPRISDAIVAGLRPHVIGGADEVEQFVGEVVAVLIDDGDVVQFVVVQQRLHAVDRAPELAAIVRHDGERGSVLGGESLCHVGAEIRTVHAQADGRRIGDLGAVRGDGFFQECCVGAVFGARWQVDRNNDAGFVV